MKPTMIQPAAIALLGALLPAAAWADPPESLVTPLKEPVQRQPVERTSLTTGVGPFAAMSGSWVGGGMISLTGEIQERLRCRATYTVGHTANALTLSIRCASDNYKFELTSNVVEHRGQFTGQWSESTYKVSGSIAGHVAGNRVSAVAKGDSFNAALSVVTRGSRQSVSIKPEATYITDVQIALNRR
jgi:hypothetical protein